MKASFALALATAFCAMTLGHSAAQSPLTPKPTTKPGQTKRTVGGGSSFGPSSAGITVVEPTEQPKTVTKRVSYMALSDNRQWLSADGKSIVARLLAFDAGDQATFIPPTVIKDDKVRLLVNTKEFVMPIAKLDARHRLDVLAIEERIKTSYAAMKAASPAPKPKGDGG